jgi:hypothetical protein
MCAPLHYIDGSTICPYYPLTPHFTQSSPLLPTPRQQARWKELQMSKRYENSNHASSCSPQKSAGYSRVGLLAWRWQVSARRFTFPSHWPSGTSKQLSSLTVAEPRRFFTGLPCYALVGTRDNFVISQQYSTDVRQKSSQTQHIESNRSRNAALHSHHAEIR